MRLIIKPSSGETARIGGVLSFQTYPSIRMPKATPMDKNAVYKAMIVPLSWRKKISCTLDISMRTLGMLYVDCEVTAYKGPVHEPQW